MTSQKKKDWCCRFILDKKGQAVVCLDLKKVTTMADYFIICTGEADVHLKAIADAVLEGMHDQGVACWHMEGYAQQRWILLDYVDVVVHIFCPELRSLYELEKLWGDAPVTTVEG